MKIFKKIPWYCYYEVNQLWEIRSIDRKVYNKSNNSYSLIKWRLLKQWNSWKWYKQVILSENWITKAIRVHKIVMITFVWKVPNWYEINHKNWIKDDNRLENLEYCTKSENQKHRFKVLWHKGSQYWKVGFNKGWTTKKAKSIKQYNLNWELIKIWRSAVDVHNILWFSKSNINLCCNWKRNTAHWFIWKFNY